MSSNSILKSRPVDESKPQLKVRRYWPTAVAILAILTLIGGAAAYFNGWLGPNLSTPPSDDRQALMSAAISEFERAIDLEPGNPEGYEWLSKAYLMADDPEAALAVYRQAIKHNPNQAWPYLELARFYLTRQDPEAALEASEQALQLDPENVENHFMHTLILYQLKRPQEAEQSRRVAAELANGDADVYLTLGRNYIDRQEWHHVTMLYQEALAQGVSNVDIYLQLGDVHSILGDQEQAMTYYRQAAVLEPFNPVVLQRLNQ